LRVGSAGLDERKMGGGALVESDEFVGFGAVEPALPAEQGVEAVPLGSVGGDEDVQIHRVCLLLGGSSAARRGRSWRS
jgi:hypothetical protein